MFIIRSKKRMLSVDFKDYHQLQTFWAQKTRKHPSFLCPPAGPQNTLLTQDNLINKNSCTYCTERRTRSKQSEILESLICKINGSDPRSRTLANLILTQRILVSLVIKLGRFTTTKKREKNEGAPTLNILPPANLNMVL